MEFDWSKTKAAENLRKHGISFSEASEVFSDPLHISVLDVRFDHFEERWISIGMTAKGRLIVVGHLYSITREQG
ncbi:MAG TPA: BrnT family toxin, partial [Thermodesulfovibrionales bacterium]|nr:BrnT family toxin [Thermodesulfovibrionales bacterium]